MQTTEFTSANKASTENSKGLLHLDKQFNLENEGIYKTIFHNSPLGIIHFDKTSQVIDCNDKFSQIIGVPREVLLTINLIKDLKNKEIIKQIKETLSSGSGFYDDYYHSLNSSKITPVIVHFNAIYSDNNEIIGGIGLVEDNTNRKEAQKKIEESEHYLREAQKFAHIGHWKRDLVTNELRRSKELFRIYNLDCNTPDIPKEVFYNLIHPDDVENVKEAFIYSLENKTEYNITFRLIFEDGTIKYINEKGRSEYDDKGKPISSMGILQDVTKIKKRELTQAALFKISDAANSDKSLYELYGSIHKIIKGLMPADNFYIALYNEESKLLSFPYHVDEIDETPEPQPLGDGLTEYVLSQKKSCIITEEVDMQLQKEGKVGISGEFTKIWIGIYLKFESTIKGVLVVQDYHDENAYSSEDIKLLEFVSKQVVKAIDKKYADEKIRESEKALKKSNADKDKFFSIISHDLKSPFQGIMGMSDLLNENISDLTEDEKVEFLDILNNSIKKVFSLIEELLEWSSVQTGRMEYKPEKIDIKKICLNVFSLLSFVAEKKELSVKYEGEENLFAFCDTKMIETVLRNLITNAIKFTMNGGTISVTAENFEDYVKIKVQDSGIGMTEEVQRKLFRIEEHHTTLGTVGEKGTGLGLILCKELIEKNKGKIWVESEVRRGSTFSFTLPEKGELQSE
ncbi:MAG: ATP-binding protein [Melioribacteraceae bacterium]|nr:ATP-binding protein [Melioribacteraceae bacterium]